MTFSLSGLSADANFERGAFADPSVTDVAFFQRTS